jgi:hypothetical protein
LWRTTVGIVQHVLVVVIRSHRFGFSVQAGQFFIRRVHRRRMTAAYHFGSIVVDFGKSNLRWLSCDLWWHYQRAIRDESELRLRQWRRPGRRRTRDIARRRRSGRMNRRERPTTRIGRTSSSSSTTTTTITSGCRSGHCCGQFL